MKQQVIVGLIGVALGAGLVLAMQASVTLGPDGLREQPPALADIAPMSLADAEDHRRARYAQLESIADVLALPSPFARREALYTLAGRADSGAVQDLIYQADGIVDRSERASTLNVLFARLAELDRASAFAVVRGPRFGNEAGFEAQVWRIWAKSDLASALAAASAERNWGARNRAAQALFAAHGYLDNETIDEIRLALGIEPDETTRSRYLHLLAERSPTAAIAYVNGLASTYERRQAAGWLAHYLGPLDPDGAAAFAETFDDPRAEHAYRQAVASATVAADPAATLERLLTEPINNEKAIEAQAAVRALAARDVDTALQYFERVQGRQHRDLLGRTLVEALAQSDPARALAWARENDRGETSMLLYHAFGQVARVDHERVLTELGTIENRAQRKRLLEAAIGGVIAQSPARAVELFERAGDIAQPEDVAANLVSQWIHRDPDAALDWALSRQSGESSNVLLVAGMQLAHTDPDAAIRLLPRVSGELAETWRRQIATSLAQNTPDRALEFLSRYDGTEDHRRLQVAVVEGLAEADIERARALADRLPDAAARGEAYAHLVAQHARADPVQAKDWLERIADERQQGFAARALGNAWYRTDPAAAKRWANALPGGLRRDYAILGMASWNPDPELRELIGSIEHDARRNQATQRLIQTLARTDWRDAQKLLDESTLAAPQKENTQQLIDHYRSRF